ncbi:MAG: UDP-N-acetylmuramoyl-tripeptide--D-alanyl-D-alanine ligase [Calditrichaeota bacterium]|nr:UDP-N-acetylmuramoyl-tripeptide--D-alanyl-D-alanine ligase [Calditrichota bacterium]
MLVESLRQTVQQLGLTIKNKDQLKSLGKISNDSRKIAKNDVYIAIVGERLDGHQFVDDKLTAHAALVICEHDLNLDIPYIICENSIQFIQTWSANYRKIHPATLIGLTGTNGKTSTKELLAHVISAKYKSYSTPGNYNNHIGLPLSLLNMPEDTELAVFEIGTNHPGEIPFLTRLLDPDLALITNIGFGHMQNFASFDDLIKEKTDIFREARPDITLFINVNDKSISSYQSQQKQVRFGVDTKADVEIKSGVFRDLKQHGSIDGMEFEIPLLGKHHLQNVAAAFAIGRYLKINDSHIAQQIATVKAVPGRMQLMQVNQYQIIHDAYNANPVSMRSALEALDQIQSDLQKVAILGDMLELGDESRLKHQEIIDYAESLAIDHIITFGNEMKSIKTKRSRHFETIDEIVNWIVSTFKNALILLKGSRGMALERVIEGLRQIDLRRGAFHAS